MAESIPFPFSFPGERRIETARQIADTVVGTVLLQA
ncbi:Hypothetical protein NGAL_HAMBI490_24960 [Neorhizobium galegae bv. officinalis]|nr:Hypothetical protein NGAL_HAMBI490_24960 [Neorhizobium galegae bv. officinalis]